MKKNKLVLFAFFGVIVFSNFASAQLNGKSEYVALYRLFNSQSDDHLYTTDCDEKENLLRDGSYVDEGVVGYVAARQTRRSLPLYRMLLSSGEHFYTTDRKEVNQLSREQGNAAEGIVGYVADESSRGTVPFYRIITGERHLYTTDEREKNRLLRSSDSRLEETEGYLWTSGKDSCESRAENDYPVIYSKTDFRGASQIIESDWNVNNDWDGSPNTIRAIRVPSGWYIAIYAKKNFRGKSFVMTNDAVFTNDNEWYNRIGSIRISKGNPPR